MVVGYHKTAGYQILVLYMSQKIRYKIMRKIFNLYRIKIISRKKINVFSKIIESQSDGSVRILKLIV